MTTVEKIDKLYDNIQSQPLSVVLTQLLPIALDCDDYEGYSILCCWNKPICKEQETNKVLIGSIVNVLKNEGISHERAKAIVAQAHEKHIKLCTLEKDKVLMFSAKEMEDKIKAYEDLFSSVGIPDGLNPTDMYFRTQGVDKVKSSIIENREIIKQLYAVLQAYIVSKLTEYRRKVLRKQEKYEDSLEVAMQVRKEPIIFLSHRSSDKKYGDALEKLIVGLGVKNYQLIYTSHPLHKIPLDKNIYDYLRENMGRETFVIILWSDEYLDSPACLNEMGAAWVMQTDYTNIYVPNFSFGNPQYHQCAVDTRKMGAVLNGDQHCKASMIEFKNKIAKMFDLQVDEQTWMYLLDEFVKDITTETVKAPRVENGTLIFD